MTLRIDRSTVRPAEANRLECQREHAAFRREINAKAGACINENKDGDHGLATHGVRCLRCFLVHRFGAVIAREMPEWQTFTPARPAEGVAA